MKRTPNLFNEEKMTPKGMVSVSQIQTFLSCKKKWKYNYIDNITPRVERSYLTIGKLCHRGMQTAMRVLWEYPNASFNDILDNALGSMASEFQSYMGSIDFLPEEVPELDQLWYDAQSVFAQALEEFDPHKYTVVSVNKYGTISPALELHFKIPCPPTKGLHGFIDAILRDKDTGFVWCVDYKFRKSLSPDEDEAFNIQNAVYAYACQKMGIEITGTMTWQHLNTPAADPAILKDGRISRSKIKTTWKHYEQFCIDHGQDPENYYIEMEEKLRDIEWYRATYEYRNPETINRIWADCVVPVAKAIKSAHGVKANNHRSLYPWNCKMCQYQSLCQAELRNYDVDAIKEIEYNCRDRV